MRRHPLIAALLGAVSIAACSDSASTRLRVGREPVDVGDREGNAGQGGGGGGAGGTGANSSENALTVHVEDGSGMTIEIVTLHCDGECAEIEAVASGGNPPYSFAWEDGSTVAARRVCLDASTTLSVTARDTAVDSSEFNHAQQTATAEVTATVLECSDGGVRDGDGGLPAGSVYWATWTAMTTGTPGSAEGTLSPPGGDVTVGYSGEAITPSAITGQPSTLLVGVATFTPESTFQSSTVPNAPPPSGMIAIAGNAMLTQTVTFSVPVHDPLVALMSLGNFGMASTCQFDATPVVLSTGPGIANQNGTLTAMGNVLTGAEGNGVVELAGTFSSISFSVTAPESTALFTVGIRRRD